MRITVNGEPRELPAGTTVGDLLGSLALPADGVAVAVNGEVVSRSSRADRPLCDGDRVELVRAVGGG